MDERFADIRQRWMFPGHHFADYTEQQVEDVNYLLDLIKQQQADIERLQVAAWRKWLELPSGGWLTDSGEETADWTVA